MEPTTITINSKQVADSLDSQIIMLVKTIQIESETTFENALETVRDYITKKHIELMTDGDTENIKRIANTIKENFKNNPDDKTANDAYRLSKYFGIYKYIN
jgi:hypothetical protein